MRQAIDIASEMQGKLKFAFNFFFKKKITKSDQPLIII